jgi:diadenosine tetraphosphate (Ap4A) HIT family hydrolase
MTEFTIHPRLDADSVFIRDLPLCQLRLLNQSAVPWLVLVPRRAEMREIFELSVADQTALMTEITQASRAMVQLYAPDKINVGAIGNIVPQLHVHVIARFTKDVVWPEPVWGRLAPAPYAPEAIEAIRVKLSGGGFWR